MPDVLRPFQKFCKIEGQAYFGNSSMLLKRFNIDIAELDRPTFALQANTAGSYRTVRSHILQHTIDQHYYPVIFANDIV